MRFQFARVLVLALLVPALALAESDSDAVRKVFGSYREALLTGKGGDAAALLAKPTFAYYEQMRQLALWGEAEAVRGQVLANQLQILLLRLRVPAVKLEKMSSRELIAYAIDEGWIGKESAGKLQPGDVLVEKDIATLAVVIEGTGAAPGFRFHREEGRWRLDLVPLLQMSSVMLQLVAKQKGVPEEQLMLEMLERVVDRKVGPEVWTPPRKAKNTAR
jgi:hypothetical protein